jgi:hypothetical protein
MTRREFYKKNKVLNAVGGFHPVSLQDVSGIETIELACEKVKKHYENKGHKNVVVTFSEINGAVIFSAYTVVKINFVQFQFLSVQLKGV